MGSPDNTLVKQTPYKKGRLPMVKDLRQMAKSYGIKNYHKLNQYELISALNVVRDRPVQVAPPAEHVAEHAALQVLTVAKVVQLRQTAKWLGV